MSSLSPQSEFTAHSLQPRAGPAQTGVSPPQIIVLLQEWPSQVSSVHRLSSLQWLRSVHSSQLPELLQNPLSPVQGDPSGFCVSTHEPDAQSALEQLFGGRQEFGELLHSQEYPSSVSTQTGSSGSVQGLVAHPSVSIQPPSTMSSPAIHRQVSVPSSVSTTPSSSSPLQSLSMPSLQRSGLFSSSGSAGPSQLPGKRVRRSSSQSSPTSIEMDVSMASQSIERCPSSSASLAHSAQT